MVNMSNKITTTTGEKVYLNLESGSTEKMGTGFKSIFDKIDKNHDGKISAEEAGLFNKLVEKYAKKDKNIKELSDNEAMLLADELNIEETPAMKSMGLTKADIVKFIMNYISSDAIAENMGKSLYGEWYKFGFGEADKEEFKKLFNEIDKNNITYVYYQYRKNSLSEDIQNFFDKETSTNMFKKLYAVMLQRAEEKNVPVKYLSDKYNQGIKNGDLNLVTKCLDELAHRLFTAETAQIYAIATNKAPAELSMKNRLKLEQLAKESNISEINYDDLAGDGILGNSESMPTSKTHKKEVEKILKVVDNMMQSPSVAEKLQAQVRKEGCFLITRFSGASDACIIRENSIVNNAGQLVEDGVVGDGDMSNFVIAIYDRAIKDGKTDVFNDDKKLEQYILSLISPAWK